MSWNVIVGFRRGAQIKLGRHHQNQRRSCQQHHSSDQYAAKGSGFLRQEDLDLISAGFRSTHRRWFSVSECERVGDQRERSPAAIPVLALLALGTLTSSVQLSTPALTSLSLHAHPSKIVRVAFPTCDNHAVRMVERPGSLWKSTRVALEP